MHGCRIAVIEVLPKNILEPECVEFPTHILDIGESYALKIKLIDSRIIMSQYITLNYRWLVDLALHFKTISFIIGERRKGIPIASMLKTFQNVITVMKKMSLKYL
jgi:hypothetical protein